jgi:hypothetical protein
VATVLAFAGRFAPGISVNFCFVLQAELPKSTKAKINKNLTVLFIFTYLN